MHRAFSSLALLAALAALSPAAQADSFEVKRCMNMGNALDAPVEGEWGHVIAADSFRVVAEAGFDTVRIPVRWSAHTGGGPDYRIDEAFFSRVTEVIDQALANDLKVILNVHHFEELNEDPKAYREKFLALWSQIAPRYQTLPDTVYFEIVNEPNGKFGGKLMRSIVTEAFHLIRETNPTRILIMGGDDWSGLRSLSTIPKIDDPNQVHTFHYYDPFKFTHQKAGWTNLKDSGTVRWGSRADIEQLHQDAQTAARRQAELGLPVFLGEIGAYEKAPYEDVIHYTYESTKAFEAAGIGWCVWNFTATFPFFDSEASQWDTLKLAALGMSPDGTAVQPQLPTSRPTARSSNDLDSAIDAIRKELGSDGEPLMPPNVDTLNTYGDISQKMVNDPDVPGGVALELRTARIGDNPWDAGVSGAVTSGIRKGETVVMAFWARAIDGEGLISNAGLQRNAPPYQAIDELKSFRLDSAWKPYVVLAEADRDYGPGEAGYSFQLAGAKQTVQLGPVVMLKADF